MAQIAEIEGGSRYFEGGQERRILIQKLAPLDSTIARLMALDCCRTTFATISAIAGGGLANASDALLRWLELEERIETAPRSCRPMMQGAGRRGRQ